MSHGLLVAIFEGEGPALAGQACLDQMHRSGALSLFGSTVVTRPGRRWSLSGWSCLTEGRAVAAPAVGAAVGALFTLLSLPLASAASTHASGLIDTMNDLEGAGLDSELLEQVAKGLKPQRAAILADVAEDSRLDLDLCLYGMGADVLRHPLAGTLREARAIDQLERLIEYLRVCRDGVETARIEAARHVERNLSRHLRDSAVKTRLLAGALRREGDAKVTLLRQQAISVDPRMRPTVEQRAERLRHRLQTRSARLDVVADAAEAALGRTWVRAPREIPGPGRPLP